MKTPEVNKKYNILVYGKWEEATFVKPDGVKEGYFQVGKEMWLLLEVDEIKELKK